jgi:ribA/ribD-fused uncharacterized protein
MIDSFTGPHRFLSNFFPSPINWGPGEVVFPTVEHGFVWHKTTDPLLRETILLIPTPGRVKRFGRKLEIRPDWEDIKLKVMRELVFEKFNHSLPELPMMLLITGERELVEGNHWGDTFWGVCDGVGHNHLGRILMDVRKELRRS